MNKNILYLLLAIGVAFYFLSPGVWWGDSLNSYIQGVTGMYGSSQPVFFAILLNIAGHLVPGPFIVFSLSALLYFTGFYLMIFEFIKNRVLAPLIFFFFSFCPLLLANMAVVQTEALQVASLALFIPLTCKLYRYNGKWRLSLFVIVYLLMAVFALVRYDTLHITLLLSYWLSYSFYKKQSKKAFAMTAILILSFYVLRYFLELSTGTDSVSEARMRNSLLVTDLAAISAESHTNYVPDYCWQPYLSDGEKTVEKLEFGLHQWRAAFYSYIYNVDPSVGLFTYEIPRHEVELRKKWTEVVLHHPVYFLKYHFTILGYLLDNNNFNLGFWSGLKDSHINHARLQVTRTLQVDSFLLAHQNRFMYENGYLLLDRNKNPITEKEEIELKKLVENRRASDVDWMKWYSQIPVNTYMVSNERSEKYVQPFFLWYKHKFRWLSCIFPYSVFLLVLLTFYTRRITGTYLRFTFIILCCCGILHLGLRAFILTDPVLRFGILAVLFTLYSIIILISIKINPQKS